jgi:hypothetical protein
MAQEVGGQMKEIPLTRGYVATVSDEDWEWASMVEPCAIIGVHGRTIFLGRFKSDEVAARAYDRAALIYHGEFARLNFPHLREKYSSEIKTMAITGEGAA